MGLAMSKRLLQAFTVRGFDPNQQRASLAKAAGVETTASADLATRGAAVALLAVRDHTQVDEALFGPEGVAAELENGGVVVLTSTVGASAARDCASALTELGIGLVDAPVSGGPGRAEEGDLLIMVGAADEARIVAEPVLRQLAGTITVVGDSAGDGQAMKTVNQLLCGVHVAAAAEALALARCLGLDLEATLATLGAGAAASFMLSHRGPRIVQALNGEEPAVLSRTDTFVKDLGIVLSAAKETGLATPIAAAAGQLYLVGRAAGLGWRDDSTLATILAPPV
jgi:3-hydroxyisobutyrate dehydrogenase